MCRTLAYFPNLHLSDISSVSFNIIFNRRVKYKLCEKKRSPRRFPPGHRLRRCLQHDHYRKRNKKENTLHAQKIKEHTPIIEEIYHSSKHTYGAARVYAVLKDCGYHISEAIVAKVMQKNGWLSVRGGAKKLHEASKSRKENILNQEFVVSAPNEVWVSDVTIYEFKNIKYYICVILDLYARKVIAFTIGLTTAHN